MVLLRNPRGDCTGTLVAPNLVATARHCVSAANLAMVCNERGETSSGGQAGADYEPGKIAVYVGASLQRAGALAPSAVGRRIVHDGWPTLCDHDLAFVVLAEPLAPTPVPVRLVTPPRVGEAFRAVGWGLSSDKSPPTERRSRAGVEIRAVGASRTYASGPHELSASEAICDGDSGGPALAEADGALLGVVTRGGSPRAAKLEPPEACKGDDLANVYVSLAAHAKLTQAAFQAAGQPVPSGPREDPCASVRCAAGSVCVGSSGVTRCEPGSSPPPAGGCAVGVARGAHPASAPLTLASVFAVVVLASRRRRARSGVV